MKLAKFVALAASLTLLSACGDDAKVTNAEPTSAPGGSQTATSNDATQAVATDAVAPTVPVVAAGPSVVFGIEPSRIQVCDGSFYGQTTVSWALSGPDTDRQVRVVLGAVDGPEMAIGTGSGSSLTEKWVHNDTHFYLVDAKSGEKLGEAVAEVHAEQCPGIVFTGPSEIADCDKDGVGVGAYSWDTQQISPWVKLYAVSQDHRSVWADGSGTGSAETGNWLSEGSAVELRNSERDELLARIPISLQTANCAAN